MVGIGYVVNVIEGVYHYLPEPLGKQVVIDEVLGSLKRPMTIRTGTIERRDSKMVPYLPTRD